MSAARHGGAGDVAVLSDAVVGDLAAFGPFFAVQTHHPGSIPREPWHMNELVADPGVLTDRMVAVRSRLAATGGQEPDAVELRVAASVTQLGLVARLVSPALAVAVSSGELLEVDLDSTRWQRVLGGAFPLSVQRDSDADASRHDANPEMIATRQPDWANRSRAIASLLLDQPPLRDTSVASAAGGFRRRSCCLIYRAAPNAAGTVCGDCVLSSDPPS